MCASGHWAALADGAESMGGVAGERTAAGRCQRSSVHEQGARQKFAPILALLSKDECLLDWQLHFSFHLVLAVLHDILPQYKPTKQGL